MNNQYAQWIFFILRFYAVTGIVIPSYWFLRFIYLLFLSKRPEMTAAPEEWPPDGSMCFTRKNLDSLEDVPPHIVSYQFTSNFEEDDSEVLVLANIILDRLNLSKENTLDTAQAEETGLATKIEYGPCALDFLINTKKVSVSDIQSVIETVCVENNVLFMNPPGIE